MEEYKSTRDLFNSLIPAFNVKLRLIKKDYYYITKTDIWNYLKINKWQYASNLTISDMVDDIMTVDICRVDKFLKEYIKNSKRPILTIKEHKYNE